MFTNSKSLALAEPPLPEIRVHTVDIPTVIVKDTRSLAGVEKGKPSFYTQITDVRHTTMSYEPPKELYDKLAPHIKLTDL